MNYSWARLGLAIGILVQARMQACRIHCNIVYVAIAIFEVNLLGGQTSSQPGIIPGGISDCDWVLPTVRRYVATQGRQRVVHAQVRTLHSEVLD
jgi:hypothetical protein